ncbi:lysylphosphatidylglycerol synthase transmembrane domain-containing protein [Microbacterium halotolerans]|uniref:lysylphosphatidylglycerol synthase transmembrane domain-containing protein n=1 Tax=Microbacterium halotolerans TaxID=246613 RepID=UPI0013C334D3|nr:lysylphosphatidylglycerol synthase transmembrane domain-containing protein [Microbacterium halotolerans]
MTWFPQTAAVVRSRRVRVWARPIAGAAILAAVVWRVGGEAFARGLLSIDVSSAAAAAGLIAAATAASAWRWRVIAQRLGAHISLPSAIALYYRSQFLNAVLPGGVLGDVHRAVAHGIDADSLAQAARAVAIERLAGQVALAAATAAVVIWTAPAFGPTVLVVMAIAAVVVALIVGAMSVVRRGRRIIRREWAQLRKGVGSGGALTQIAVSSTTVLACHVALFAVAASAVGIRLPFPQLIGISLVALLGAAIPTNIAGWGPREGVVGWVFHTVGLTAAAGVAASTAFGLLVLIAVVPGAFVLLVGAVRGRHAHGPASYGGAQGP